MKTYIFVGLAALLLACGGGSPAPGPVPMQPVAVAGLVQGEEEPSLLAPVLDEAGPGVPQAADFALGGYAPPGEGSSLPPALMPAARSGTRLYVSPKGSDNNPGSAEKPMRSLARAARAVSAGMTVLVAPGTYGGGFRSNASGKEGERIAFVSTRKWGARIVPPKNSANKTAWDNRGNHVDIVGFEVDGSQYAGGTRWSNGIYNGGSYVSVRNNHVHHIAKGIGCTRAGGAAIGLDSYYGGVQSDAISNLVHDIGPAGCRFVQGIYVSTSGMVKNNVIYRVAEGGIHLWHDAHNVIITNNTVTASNTGIIVGSGNHYRSSGLNDHTAVYSNIVYDNTMGISEQGRTGSNNTYRNNLVYQNSSYNWQLKNGIRHEGTVSLPPDFLGSARSGAANLKLSGNSPAIGRASPAHAEETDFEGRPRNRAAGYDIGAYQH